MAVRHALEILCELAAKDPYSVAMALGEVIIFQFLSNSLGIYWHRHVLSSLTFVELRIVFYMSNILPL